MVHKNLIPPFLHENDGACFFEIAGHDSLKHGQKNGILLKHDLGIYSV